MSIHTLLNDSNRKSESPGINLFFSYKVFCLVYKKKLSAPMKNGPVLSGT